MTTPSNLQKIRYEIERRFKMYAKEAEGSEKADFWRDAISEVNDVFDPFVSSLLQCPACHRIEAFEVDKEKPNYGYCYAEDKLHGIKTGEAILSKCICGHTRLSHQHYTENDTFCSISDCTCDHFHQKRQ